MTFVFFFRIAAVAVKVKMNRQEQTLIADMIAFVWLDKRKLSLSICFFHVCAVPEAYAVYI